MHKDKMKSKDFIMNDTLHYAFIYSLKLSCHYNNIFQ